MAERACRYYPSLSPPQMRWVLVEATGRILPVLDLALAWVPTLNHKVRILADWAISTVFHADTIPLSELEHPGQEFTRALDIRQFTEDHEGGTVMATTSA
jgi:hypothetical protein